MHNIDKIHAQRGGWPPGWTFLPTAEKILKVLGCPVGAEPRAALIMHYGSRDGTRIKGPRGLDKTIFKMLIGHTFWVLKCAEQDKWRYGGEGLLECLEMAYKVGYTPAAKHGYRFCVQMKRDKPPFVRDWERRVLKDAARTPSREKKSPGRHKGPTPKKIMEDLKIFVLVNFWCHQVLGIYRSGKPHWISSAIARQIVSGMLFSEKAEDKDIETIKKTYKRTITRFLRAAGGVRFSKRTVG